MSRISVYLAAPWFTPRQKEIMTKVRNVLLEVENIEIYAPFYDGVVLNKDNDSPEVRQQVYDANIDSIVGKDLVCAIIDDFDPGTLFEMGFSAGLRWDVEEQAAMWRDIHQYLLDRKRPMTIPWTDATNLEYPKIIAYSDVAGRGLNVMLRQAVWGFANGLGQLREQLIRFKGGEPPANYYIFEKGDVL